MYVRQGDHQVGHWPTFLVSIFSSLNLSGWRLKVYHTSAHGACGLNANLECMSEMCCTRLVENTERKKIAILAPSHNFVGLYLRMHRQLEKIVKHRYLLHMSS